MNNNFSKLIFVASLLVMTLIMGYVVFGIDMMFENPIEITIAEKLSIEEMREIDQNVSDPMVITDEGQSLLVSIEDFYALTEGERYCVRVLRPGRRDAYITVNFGYAPCIQAMGLSTAGTQEITVTAKHKDTNVVFGVEPPRLVVVDQEGKGYLADAALFAGLTEGQRYCVTINSEGFLFTYHPLYIVENLGAGACR